MRARNMCYSRRFIVGAIIDDGHKGALPQGFANGPVDGLFFPIRRYDDPKGFSVARRDIQRRLARGGVDGAHGVHGIRSMGNWGTAHARSHVTLRKRWRIVQCPSRQCIIKRLGINRGRISAARWYYASFLYETRFNISRTAINANAIIAGKPVNIIRPPA